MKYSWIIILSVFLLFSCGGKEARFGSAKAVVTEFIDAAVSQDVDRLSECISSTAESADLKTIREKKISENDMAGISDAFDGAVISGEQMVGSDNKAIVSARLETRNIEIVVVNDGALWKIASFSESNESGKVLFGKNPPILLSFERY